VLVTFVVGWLLAAGAVALLVSLDLARFLALPLCPFVFCPELPTYLGHVSRLIAAAPVLIILVLMARPQISALLVWAHGTVVVYWIWAGFLMTARCLVQ